MSHSTCPNIQIQWRFLVEKDLALLLTISASLGIHLWRLCLLYSCDFIALLNQRLRVTSVGNLRETRMGIITLTGKGKKNCVKQKIGCYLINDDLVAVAVTVAMDDDDNDEHDDGDSDHKNNNNNNFYFLTAQ